VIDRVAPVLEPACDAQAPDHFGIQFNHVFFRYHENATQVLSDVNLHLSSGKKLAIVGPTGSGKSSLIQLLLRYREPQSGKISFGGRSITDYRSEQLHEWIAVVPQQVHLFNTTIRNNLLLAKPDTTEDEINRVCSLAQLDDFIQQQPDGLDTWVGETGVKVSGGQARRIAIARALLRDFECLVLDEPGEGLDSKTESALISGLIKQLKGKSLLLITHTQSGLDLMDEVIEFKATG
jgi:ATP-binding cassette, subfamily C, bacterial CydC